MKPSGGVAGKGCGITGIFVEQAIGISGINFNGALDSVESAA